MAEPQTQPAAQPPANDAQHQPRSRGFQRVAERLLGQAAALRKDVPARENEPPEEEPEPEQMPEVSSGEAKGQQQAEPHSEEPSEGDPDWFVKRTKELARQKNEAVSRAKESDSRIARLERELVELRNRTKGQDAREAITQRAKKSFKDDEALLTPEHASEIGAIAAEEFTKGFDEDRETLRRIAARERVAESLDAPLTPKQLAAVTSIHMDTGLDAEDALLIAQKRNPDLFGQGAEPPQKNPATHYQQRQNGQPSPNRLPKDARKDALAQAAADMTDGSLTERQRAEAARFRLRERQEGFVQRVQNDIAKANRRRGR